MENKNKSNKKNPKIPTKVRHGCFLKPIIFLILIFIAILSCFYLFIQNNNPSHPKNLQISLSFTTGTIKLDETIQDKDIIHIYARSTPNSSNIQAKLLIQGELIIPRVKILRWEVENFDFFKLELRGKYLFSKFNQLFIEVHDGKKNRTYYSNLDCYYYNDSYYRESICQSRLGDVDIRFLLHPNKYYNSVSVDGNINIELLK